MFYQCLVKAKLNNEQKVWICIKFTIILYSISSYLRSPYFLLILSSVALPASCKLTFPARKVSPSPFCLYPLPNFRVTSVIISFPDMHSNLWIFDWIIPSALLGWSAQKTWARARYHWWCNMAAGVAAMDHGDGRYWGNFLSYVLLWRPFYPSRCGVG